MGKLKIGISCCFFHADPLRPVFKGKTLVYSEQSISHWAMSQGAMAFLIPPPAERSSVTLKDLAGEMDCLILQGGSDVSPKNYGETPLKPEWAGDYVRDLYEIALLKEFVAQGKPVLGVCRGAQLINVAYGGTLYQDIQTQIPGALNHRNWDIYDQNFHQIEFVAGSRLAQLYGGMKTAKINTVHHQALKDLGKGLVSEARCPNDGVIDAVRLKSDSDSGDWVAAVQWHPEFHDPKDKSLLDSSPILKDFLEQAKGRKKC